MYASINRLDPEEIQGLTSYPENFLFRGHRKCSNSVHLSVV